MATFENTQNTDFLRFSAYSFKDMITRKFSENTKFTDQVYEGSNLAILIDLCAYLFQGLTYCVNTAAAESMFSDTQIYQNINRLVKLIGYNPKGFIPSSATFQFTVAKDDDDLYIPMYSAIDTGKSDGRGKRVYYSFAECYDLAGGKCEVSLVNGKWKMYPTVFTASGTNYETFELAGVQSDADTEQYVAYGYIDVYVERNGTFLKFKGLTDEIFLNSTSKYSADSVEDTIDIYKNTDKDRYYSVRLNHNKTYEIKFGNDNNGQKLQKGDQVYVFYLDSNGFDAQLNIGDVAKGSIIDPCTVLGVTDDFMFRKIIYSDPDTKRSISQDDIDRIKELLLRITDVTNVSQGTKASLEESVEDIRNLAPDYYKLGNRLITKSDFEYYIKNRYKDNIIDVKCQNNWDYISKFYGWLYRLGLTGVRTEGTYKSHDVDGAWYITQSRLTKYDYYFADPADENNVYLWVKMQNDKAIMKQRLDEDLTAIKVLTSEMVFVDPVRYMFAVCAAPQDRALKYLVDDSIFDEDAESYIEITISDNSLYSNASVKVQVNQIFMRYFNQFNTKIGQVVNVNDILNQIYAIPGVQNVRTVFSSNEVDAAGNRVYSDRFVTGLSFASWSQGILDVGDDLVIGTTNRALEDFQCPVLYNSSVTNRIRVIKKSFSNNSTVQY